MNECFAFLLSERVSREKKRERKKERLFSGVVVNNLILVRELFAVRTIRKKGTMAVILK